jgi:hypothetical protein
MKLPPVFLLAVARPTLLRKTIPGRIAALRDGCASAIPVAASRTVCSANKLPRNCAQ